MRGGSSSAVALCRSHDWGEGGRKRVIEKQNIGTHDDRRGTLFSIKHAYGCGGFEGRAWLPAVAPCGGHDCGESGGEEARLRPNLENKTTIKMLGAKIEDKTTKTKCWAEDKL
jgi:hypothetical protein